MGRPMVGEKRSKTQRIKDLQNYMDFEFKFEEKKETINDNEVDYYDHHDVQTQRFMQLFVEDGDYTTNKGTP